MKESFEQLVTPTAEQREQARKEWRDATLTDNWSRWKEFSSSIDLIAYILALEAEVKRLRKVAEVVELFAAERPETKCDIVAAIALGMLIPLTDADIEYGRQLAKQYNLSAPPAKGEQP